MITNQNVNQNYADVCKSTYVPTEKNTRHIIFEKDPSLLVKLKNMAKQFLAKKQ